MAHFLKKTLQTPLRKPHATNVRHIIEINCQGKYLI